MKKTARVISHIKVRPEVPGVLQRAQLDYTSLAKVIGGITVHLKDYEEVVITGGEPMINPAQLY